MLRTAVNLISENPRASLRSRCTRRRHRLLVQGRAGGIVGMAEGDQPCPRCDQSSQLIEVRLPAQLLAQPPGFDDGAETRSPAFDLRVIRAHQDDLVSRLDERPYRK